MTAETAALLPDVQAFLDALKAQPRPPMSDAIVAMIRQIPPGTMPSPDLPVGDLAVIRDLAISIAPIIPTSACRLLDQMGIAADARDFAAIEDQSWYDALRASGYKVGQPVPLFPRLELEIAED